MGPLFVVPSHIDARERRTAENVLGVLKLLLSIVVLTVAISLVPSQNPTASVLGTYIPTTASLLLCVWLARHGRARLASWILSSLLFVLVTVVIYVFGGVMANNGVAYILAVMVAGTTLGTRAAIFFAVLSAATAGLMVLLESHGLLPPSLSPVSVTNAWIAITITLLCAALLHRMSIRSLDRALTLSEDARRALVQAQAHSELRGRLGDTLARLSESALASHDMATLSRIASQAVVTALGLERAVIVEVDDNGRVVSTDGAAGPLPTSASSSLVPAALESLSSAGGTLALDAPPLASLCAALVLPCRASGLALAIRGRDRARGLLVVVPPAEAPALANPERTFLDTVALLLGAFVERERARERAERSQKLEVVGRVANGIAHDFNNLLMVVLGVSHELRQLHSDEVTLRTLGELEAASQHGALLTRQLLTFSRRQRAVDQDIDLSALARELLPILRRLAGDDVQFVAHLPDVPTVVRADRGNLEQVILNLVVNAREAMPDGGAVTITIATPTAERVLLSIADTGTGMDDATRERIFQPFFTTKPNGTGLGLATVSDIVQRHGGTIDVSSKLGRGSEFRVGFPRVAVAVQPLAAPAPSPSRPGRGLKVLLAEDHDLVRASAVRVLKRAGHEVVAVINGRDALALIEGGQRFDVLVSDVAMPELGGTKLLTSLDGQGRELPTVLMSGHVEGLPELSPRMAPMVRFVPKPFTADTLLAAIDAVLLRRA